VYITVFDVFCGSFGLACAQPEISNVHVFPGLAWLGKRCRVLARNDDDRRFEVRVTWNVSGSSFSLGGGLYSVHITVPSNVCNNH